MSKSGVSFAPIREILSECRNLLLGRRHALSSSEIPAPFFIVGSGRCGTTLLRRLLESHGEILIPPEIYALKAAVNRFKRNSFKNWDHLVDLTLATYQFDQSNEDIAVNFRPLARKLKAAESEKRSLAFIIDSVYRCIGEEKGFEAKYWGDKTPLNIDAISEIFAVFPNARVIFMVRQPVDVVHSMLEMGRYDNAPDAVERWRNAVNKGLAGIHDFPRQVMLLRYEDLVASTESVLRGVCNFLQIDWRSSMLQPSPTPIFQDAITQPHLGNSSRPVFSASVGKGGAELPTQVVQEILSMTSKEVQLLGYHSGMEKVVI